MSHNAVTKVGWLTKRGAKRKNWKRRWFVLAAAEQTLCYYKSQADQDQDTVDPHGTISLRDCSSCAAAEDATQKQNSFMVNVRATP